MPEQLRSETLQVTTSRPRPDQLVVRAGGEIDVSTAGLLKQVLKDEMQASAGPGHAMDPFADEETGGEPVAVVDLTDVTFMDSTGLGALIAAREHAARLGRSWRLAGLQPSVHRVLALSGGELLFGIYPDLAAALAGPAA